MGIVEVIRKAREEELHAELSPIANKAAAGCGCLSIIHK
jgi:hypothetical protein